MIVSPWISVGPFGPVTCAGGVESLVHVRQGELDGACGPYSLIMAMITLGVIGRQSVVNMSRWSGNTREVRFRKKLEGLGALVNGGSNCSHLADMADCFAGVGMSHETCSGTKKVILDSVLSAIEEDRVPLIGLEWMGGEGHWLMVVGYQGFEDEDTFQLTHLLCLDPDSEAPRASLWNGVLQVYHKDGSSYARGPFPSVYWGLDGQQRECRLTEAFIVDFEA